MVWPDELVFLKQDLIRSVRQCINFSPAAVHTILLK